MKKNKLLSARAILLLRKVQAQLRLKPKTYNQNEDGGFSIVKPDCGSPACIIGWMRWFNRRSRRHLRYDILTNDQFDRLYDASQWPEKFHVSNEGDAWHHIKPRTAIARIDLFIKSDGEK